MKNKLIFLLCVYFLSGISCTEDSFMYDDPTDIGMFSQSVETISVQDGTGEELVDVWVVSPVRCDVDRYYSVSVLDQNLGDEEAIQGVNYEFASSAMVTIPAGELRGSLKLRVFQNTLRAGDKIVNLKLTAIDESHPVAGFNTETSILLSRICHLELEDLTGIYTLADSYVVEPGNSFQVVLDPDYDDGLIMITPYNRENNIRLKVWRNQTNGFSVMTREDTYIFDYTYENVLYPMYGGGTGSFDACKRELKMEITIWTEKNSSIGGLVNELFIQKQ